MAVINTITSSGHQLAPEVKTYYELKLLERLLPNLIHQQFGMQKSIPRNGGTTIDHRRFESLSTASNPIPINEAMGTMPLPVTVTNVQSTPQQYGDYIQHSDRISLQAIDPVVEEFIKLIKEHAGRVFDLVVRNAIILGTNIIYCGNVLLESQLDDNCKASVYAFKRASRLLDDNNAIMFGEEGGSYVGLITPAVSYDLMRDQEWIEANKYGKPQALFKNEIGMIAGIRFVKSTLAYINFGGGSSTAANIVNSRSTNSVANTYHNIVLSVEAYACVGINNQQTPEMLINAVGSAGSADPLSQIGTVGFKGFQAGMIADNNRLVNVVCTATL